jgi:hypothetical protein
MAALLGVGGLVAMAACGAVDDLMATSATGTARVVGVDPLTVDLEVVASGAGRQLPIDGLLTVRHVTWTESCFQ